MRVHIDQYLCKKKLFCGHVQYIRTFQDSYKRVFRRLPRNRQTNLILNHQHLYQWYFKQTKRPQSPPDKFITTKSCNHWQNRSLRHKHLMVAGWRRLCLWQQICNTSRSWASNRWRHSPGRTIKPLGHCFAFNHHTRLWSSFFGAFCCVTGDKCLKRIMYTYSNINMYWTI